MRRHLQRRPKTTRNLLKKNGIQNAQLVQLLAKIHKKIKPYKHKVKSVTCLSVKDEKNSTKDGSDWDEPLRDKLAKEAGAVLEEMVWAEDDSYPLSKKSAGGKGRPELCGWRGGGKPASATCLHSSPELAGAGSKDKARGYRPLMSKARVTPSPKIEEGL